MRKITILSAVVVLSFIVTIVAYLGDRAPDQAAINEFNSYDSRDGKKEAEADLARKTPKWIIYGLPGGDDDRHERLRSKLGIQEKRIAGCGVSEGVLRYHYQYNSTIRAYFVELCGEEYVRDILGEALRDPEPDFHRG